MYHGGAHPAIIFFQYGARSQSHLPPGSFDTDITEGIHGPMFGPFLNASEDYAILQLAEQQRFVTHHTAGKNVFCQFYYRVLEKQIKFRFNQDGIISIGDGYSEFCLKILFFLESLLFGRLMDSATAFCARPLFYATAFRWLLK